MADTRQGTVAGLSSLFGGESFVPRAAVNALTLPQAAPAAPDAANMSANQDAVASLMRDLDTPLDPSVLRAGMTPVSTGPATGIVPASLTRPVAPFQDRLFNTQPVIGAGNARARGIGNAITGVTNAVGHVVAAKKQMDQDKLSVSTQRLLQSQQAINQAQMFLKDPNIDPERKQALMDSVERNQKVMGTILDDKKIRGDLEKGFNISFTDPNKNKTDQHTGVQDGIKSFREQFQEQMPQTVGEDPLASAQMKLAIQERTSAQKYLPALMGRIMTAQSAMERTRFTAMRNDIRELSRQRAKWVTLAATFQQQEKMQGIRHDDRMDEITQFFNYGLAKQEEYLKNKALDPETISKDREKFETDYQRNRTSLQQKLTEALAAKAALMKARNAAQDRGDPGLADLNSNLFNLTQNIATIQDNLTNIDRYHAGQLASFDEWSKQAGLERERRNQQRGGGTSGAGASSTGQPTGTGGIEEPVKGPRPGDSITGGGGGVSQITPPGGGIPANLPVGVGGLLPALSFYSTLTGDSDDSEAEDRDNEYDDEQ